jgi:UDP-N-acetylmuramoyl-tripeptide--D-alanyl-D-alanine ligase
MTVATLMTLAQAHAMVPGSTLVGNGHTALLRVHTDTRTLRAGDLFVALRGERFDGNDFLPQARAAGAVAALAERGLGEAGDGGDGGEGMPGLRVPDALAALQQLAAAWRARLQLPLIAVTGSNGKTTVTQMVAAMLRAWCGSGALATSGNLNNHIGVPLTLLRLRQDGAQQHRAAVLELGMNHPGEIALLAGLVAPTVALVNNAQREHQEFMATVLAVAQENGSVISALPANGTAVFPADDTYTPLWRGLAGTRRVMTFALHGAADVTATAVWMADAGVAGQWALTLHTPVGDVATTLGQPGEHNLRNALAASACALAAGAPLAAVAQGLAGFEPVAGRSQISQLQLRGQRVTLIDDSYNANPDSVIAAIRVLAAMPGPRWLLLGDMGEVGAQGPQFHAEVGAVAQQAGIEHVWSTGTLCAHLGTGRHFEQKAALLAALLDTSTAPVAAAVLVKGSRFMKMEQVVQALRTQSQSQSQPQAQAEAPHAA